MTENRPRRTSVDLPDEVIVSATVARVEEVAVPEEEEAEAEEAEAAAAEEEAPEE